MDAEGAGLERGSREQSRACYPNREGYVRRDGVGVFYEVYGDADETILFLPTWSIMHSRHWKAQIPYFARHYRVLTFDGRGNGKSDRPADPSAYAPIEFAKDALAVMAETGTDRAAVVGMSAGARWLLLMCALDPDRVASAAFIGPGVPLTPDPLEGADVDFNDVLQTEEGWAKFNRHYWVKDYRGFLDFFFSKMFTEPHSTKQLEDGVGWALETTPETLIATVEAIRALGTTEQMGEQFRALCTQVKCPVLVLHGDEDEINPHVWGAELARLTNGDLVTLSGSGHAPHARDPVKVNLLIRDFVDPGRVRAPTWTRGKNRTKRALFISSPIGLGHARRDLAIARELRKLHPDLEIDWLAQDPVTRVLNVEGERIHPASKHLASESGHMESESAGHDLHCFQAWRRMDEILVANFMLFHDVVTEDYYDLWIGDEAWELDYYLHENPEQKRAAYAWLTDFVGWLPMPDGGERESYLTADYNAEMIEHIARFPRIRDRAIFIGTPDDIVPESFGPGLPPIRQWTEAHFNFSGGYITGFDPGEHADREALRSELGYRPDEKVCIVTVGGSGVGGELLKKVMASFPGAKKRVTDLRMIVVAGPRIDVDSLPQGRGFEVRSYVHDLYKHLAACDLAVVQGGLTTSMELTANKRPFLYFPLRNHFEQNFHVRHRLNRYGSGRCMDFEASTPDVIAEAIAEEIGREVAYEDVESGTTERAAALIAEML